MRQLRKVAPPRVVLSAFHHASASLLRRFLDLLFGAGFSLFPDVSASLVLCTNTA
jgi:hypothetical protein